MQAQSRAICNVCQSTNTQVVALLQSEIDGKEYSAVKCRQCGLVFAFPIPELSFDALQNVYGEGYTEGQRKISTSDQAIRALRDAVSRQMDIVERHVEKGVALNVGAMSDAIKVLEERGWKLRIVEVSSYAAETARRLWGFDVTVSRIEDFECSPATFDFIKLGHVIEHLADPRLAVQRLATLLKPGGVILIDTDNAYGLKTQIEVTIRRLLGENLSASLVQKLTKKNLRKRYGRLTPPEHLYCFSEKSLTKLLEDAGFEVVRVFKPAWGDPTWFPLTDQSGFSTIEKIFIRLDQIGARFGFGDVIAVLAKKR
jgi:SAM-dependent methyltransferase